MKLSRLEMEEDVKQFFALVRERYSYIEEKKLSGVDLDMLHAGALKRLDKVQSDADFHRLLQEIVSGLKDGHCEVDKGCLDVPWPRAAWPVALQSVQEGTIITAIHPSAAAQGFGHGDLLKEVNGRAIEDWIQDTARRVSASTAGARRRLALQRVILTDEEIVQLGVEYPNGTNRDVSANTCSHMPVPAVPNIDDLPEGKYIESRVLENGIGAIRITSMSWGIKPEEGTPPEDMKALFKPARDAIDAAFATVAGTKALVLDVRGNHGGFDYVGAHVAAHFLPDEQIYVRHITRSWPPAQEDDEREARISDYTSFRGARYAGDVAVLIDEGTFSATDTLAAALTDWRPEVRFIGRPTHGGAGGPTEVGKLEYSNVGVRLCVMKLWSPKNRRLIEGHGTNPQVGVEWTREDVLKCRDADLVAALKGLRE
jgi:C-terminal processing protease CtpA/Prc